MTTGVLDSQARALGWITQFLSARQIPFQAVGGLAARAYGASRPLVDLDFYVPSRYLGALAAAIAQDNGASVVRSPEPYQDAAWNLTFLAVEYGGQRIELGGADGARYFDRATGEWREAAIDFSRSVSRTVLGYELPCMPLAELLAYKRVLDREVDRFDLAELEGRAEFPALSSRDDG